MEPLNFGIFDWVEASATLAPAEVYAHKLDLAGAADAAGFHGMFLAEHQGTPLSIDGSPSVLLSAIFQRTRRLRAGALTYCLPWHDPYRLYHEVCMLDQLSGGRLELGVGRGVSPIESKIFGMGSIEESRERYREALEVFFRPAATRRWTSTANSSTTETRSFMSSRCRSRTRRCGFRAATASRSSSPRATATTPRFSGSSPTASPISSATARCGNAIATIPGGTTRT